MTTPFPIEIADYIGILRDEEIRRAIDQDILLEKATCDPDRVRQASYELRLSKKAKYLRFRDGKGETKASYEEPLNEIDKTLHIGPGQTVHVQVMETFRLPNDIVAHVIPVGNVYKVGLSPETTFADPGFDGPFYVILTNPSPRVVELETGGVIARAEFVKLAKATPKPHQGSEYTSEVRLWPYRVPRLSREELKAQGVDSVLKRLETIDPPHCEHVFVTREVREEAAQRLSDAKAISERMSKLEAVGHKTRIISIIGLALLAATILIYLISALWPLFPQSFKTSVPEGIGEGIGGAIAAGVTATALWFWSKLKK